MKRQLVRNLVLVGTGATLALVIGAAPGQEAAPQPNAPAQLDRSFENGNDNVRDGQGGAATAGGADGGTIRRGAGPARGGMDGGTGGAGDAEAAQPASGERATREDHTNIILYGPNGLPEGAPNPNATDDQATGGGGGAGTGRAGTEDGEAAPEGEHTDIDVYGPMGR